MFPLNACVLAWVLAEDEILAVWFTVHLRDTEQKSLSVFCSRKGAGCVLVHSVNGQTPRVDVDRNAVQDE